MKYVRAPSVYVAWFLPVVRNIQWSCYKRIFFLRFYSFITRDSEWSITETWRHANQRCRPKGTKISNRYLIQPRLTGRDSVISTGYAALFISVQRTTAYERFIPFSSNSIAFLRYFTLSSLSVSNRFPPNLGSTWSNKSRRIYSTSADGRLRGGVNGTG